MRFIPFPASSILSTKNAHKFCTFLLFAFTKVFTHMSPHVFLLFFFSWFWRVTTHARILYDFISPLSSLCHRRMHFRNFLFFLHFLNASWLRSARALSRLALLLFCFVYSNLRAPFNQLQSVCLFCLALLVCSSSIPPIQRDALRF